MDRSELEVLLDSPALIDIREEHGASALLMAAKAGNTKIVQMLLRAGANIELQDQQGWTALMHATEQGHLKPCRH